MADADEVLGDNVVRLLSDKLYENRKQAALEIEKKVREALISTVPGRGRANVQMMLDVLRRDYIECQTNNLKRKGGLIGVASVAIGLEGEIGKFLQQLVSCVLVLFRDEDSRVRYYACEALFNISKVASKAVLEHFNEIFDSLCNLAPDVDTEVRNAVQVVDRLLKDIVSYYPAEFRVADFIPLLKTSVMHKSPFIRQLVLAWIALLLKEPQIDMVQYLPEYLTGLFRMLADTTRDVRHNADACLQELLKSVTSSPDEKALPIISDTAGIVVEFCTSEDGCSRLAALCWLHEFVHIQIQRTSQVDGRPGQKWIKMLPDLLGGTLHCVDDPEEEIARMAIEMNNGLLEMVQNLQSYIPVDALVDKLLQSMQPSRDAGLEDPRKGSMTVRTACLQWICMLLVQCREKMMRRSAGLNQQSKLDRLFDAIYETLLHPDDEVVAAALGVLAQIMEGRKDEEEEEQLRDEHGRDLFTVIANRLLELFQRERNMLEVKGRLMIRHLCGHLDARRLYVTVAQSIQHDTTELEFARQLVQTFSWILFTASETKALREELLNTAPMGDGGPGLGARGDRSLFLELLEPWFHNPVSALALCLWAQQYELATELTDRFATFEPTLDLLKQLDQLVHLLESPVFSRLRLRLLEPRKHPALHRCVLGLAMLLPQSGAFHLLGGRLRVAQSGLLLEAQRDEAPADAQAGGQEQPHVLSWVVGRGGAAARGKQSEGVEVDIATLLERFDSVTAAAQA